MTIATEPAKKKSTPYEAYNQAVTDKERTVAAFYSALTGLINVVLVVVEAEYGKRKS